MRIRILKSLRSVIWVLPLLLGRGAAQSFNFVSFDVPCSACPGGIARQTTPQGINPGGDIVGFYFDAVGAEHGFLLSGGQFTTIDVPGALVGAAGILPTSPRGIDPSGDIVGAFTAPVSNAPLGSPRSYKRDCVNDHRKRRIGTDGNRQGIDRPNAGRV